MYLSTNGTKVEMDIKFCITSNAAFSHHTYPVIIPSLTACGVNASSIFFIEGGHINRTTSIQDGVNYIKTGHNSVEYTSLIDIVEHNMHADYWVLLHDTCRVGKDFFTLSQNIPDGCEKVALKHWPSMSIGAYKYSYLKKHTDRLMQIKNTDYSRDRVQHWKQWGIHNEDYMLWRESSSPCALYNPHLELREKFVVCEEAAWYNTNTTRRVEYYAQLDLYKSKANWHPKPWMEIDV